MSKSSSQAIEGERCQVFFVPLGFCAIMIFSMLVAAMVQRQVLVSSLIVCESVLLVCLVLYPFFLCLSYTQLNNALQTEQYFQSGPL